MGRSDRTDARSEARRPSADGSAENACLLCGCARFASHNAARRKPLKSSFSAMKISRACTDRLASTSAAGRSRPFAVSNSTVGQQCIAGLPNAQSRRTLPMGPTPSGRKSWAACLSSKQIASTTGCASRPCTRPPRWAKKADGPSSSSPWISTWLDKGRDACQEWVRVSTNSFKAS